MKKLLFIFLLTTISFSQTNYWKSVKNRLVPISPSYGIDLRSGIYGTTGLRLGYSNQADSGSMRYDAGYVSYYNGSGWITVATSAGGSVGDADSLGGIPASDYARLSISNTFTGTPQIFSAIRADSISVKYIPSIVSTIAEMITYSDSSNVLIVSDTLRGGVFYYTTVGIVDSGTVFPATGKGSGRWQRKIDEAFGFNVKWFGAKGDYDTASHNGTDDRRTIQMAIDSRPRRNVTIYFPRGSYKVGDSLQIGEETKLVGLTTLFPYEIVSGDTLKYQNQTALYFTGTGNGIVTTNETVGYRNQGIVIENLGIFGTGKDNGKIGIYLRANANATTPKKFTGLSRLTNLYISGWGTGVSCDGSTSQTFATGGQINNCKIGYIGGTFGDKVEKVDFYTIDSIGLKITGNSSVIYKNLFEVDTTAINLLLSGTVASYATISENGFITGKNAIRMENSSTVDMRGKIINNIFRDMVDTTIALFKVKNLTISGNTFDNRTYNRGKPFIYFANSDAIKLGDNLFDCTSGYNTYGVIYNTTTNIQMGIGNKVTSNLTGLYSQTSSTFFLNTLNGNLVPAVTNSQRLGDIGNGWSRIVLEHGSSQADGIILRDTSTSAANSPRLYFENQNAFPAGGVAIYQTAANAMTFTTGATGGSATGTARWFYSTSAIAPNTSQLMDLGTASLPFNRIYGDSLNLASNVVAKGKSTMDSLSVAKQIYMIAVSSDSTTVATGGLYIDASGFVRRKY